MPHDERNKEICQRYRDGEALHDIAARFDLSTQRIKQILKKRGAWKPRPQTNRDEFLGVNLTEEDKTALRAEAARRGLSMSSMTADWIKEMLITLHKETPV